MSKEIKVAINVSATAQYISEGNYVYVQEEDESFDIWFSKQDLLDMLKLFEEQEK